MGTYSIILDGISKLLISPKPNVFSNNPTANLKYESNFTNIIDIDLPFTVISFLYISLTCFIGLYDVEDNVFQEDFRSMSFYLANIEMASEDDIGYIELSFNMIYPNSHSEQFIEIILDYNQCTMLCSLLEGIITKAII